MANDKVHTTIDWDKQTHEKLKESAAKNFRSVTAEVHAIIHQFFARKEQ
jgi:plasmid stability protein